MRLYLDIDGTLVTARGEPAPYLPEFLQFVTDRFECYWLTTHCHGDPDKPFLYLVGKLPSAVAPLLAKIRPTAWETLKTEAIDFSGDFLWLDDYVMEAERRILAEHNAEGRHIPIDLEANPHRLQELVTQWQAEEKNGKGFEAEGNN